VNVITGKLDVHVLFARCSLPLPADTESDSGWR